MIRTGMLPIGLRWAGTSAYRVVAYAQGGHSCQRYVRGVGWCLFPKGEHMPRELYLALCAALNITPLED